MGIDSNYNMKMNNLNFCIWPKFGCNRSFSLYISEKIKKVNEYLDSEKKQKLIIFKYYVSCGYGFL